MSLTAESRASATRQDARSPLLATAVNPYAIAVWCAMLGWCAVVFAVVRSYYDDYRLARLDLGNMVQAVWSTAHGRPLEVTTGYGDQVSRLSGHVDPILVLFAPLWVLLPTPLVLAAAQVGACAAGALPVFWLARRHLGSERAAVLLAFAYLAYPWLAWTALDAIHPVTLAIPLLLYALWFLDGDRPVPFSICAVLVLATGELMGLTLAALGVWYAIARGHRRAGLAIAVAGAGWTFVALFVVVPAFSGGDSVFYGFYERVGGSPGGLVATMLTNPATILAELFGANVLLFLFALMAPLAAAPVLATGLAATAIPQLSLNALADPVGPTDPRQHYLAAIVPIFFAAAVLGLARLRPHRRLPATATILALCILFSVALGPWPGLPDRAPLWYQDEVSPARVAALNRAVALVPEGAPASSTNKVGLRLSARRYLALAPVVGKAKWVVVDSEDPALVHPDLPVVVRDEAGLADWIRELGESSMWQQVYAEDGVYVFRRVGG